MIKAKFVGKMYKGFSTGDIVTCVKVRANQYKTFGYSGGKYHCFTLPSSMIEFM